MIRPFYERVRACIDDLCFEKNQAIYSVAHRTLHLHYATSSLFAQLHRALHHQQVHRATGDLTLYVWDSASTGLPMVPSPFPPQAFGRRHSVKLTAQSIDRLPTLAVPTAAGDDGKTIFWLYPTYAIADNLPIQAILLPQIATQAETTVARTTASAALRALAPTTIFQLAASGQAALQRLARLAATVPAYHLSIGQDATLMTAAIRTLLSGQA